MPGRSPSNLADILESLELQVAAGLSLDPSCVIVTIRDDEDVIEAPPSSFFVTIQPHSGDFDQGLAAGAGNNAIGIDCQIRICLWSSLNVDRQGQSPSWLKDVTNGILAKWRLLIANLQLFDPAGPAGLMLEEPMRCTRWSAHPPRRGGSFSGLWGKLESEWDVRYLQDISITGGRTILGGKWLGIWEPDWLGVWLD